MFNLFRQIYDVSMRDAMPWNIKKNTFDYFDKLLTPEIKKDREVMLELFENYSNNGDEIFVIYLIELSHEGKWIKQPTISHLYKAQGKIERGESSQPIFDRKSFDVDPKTAAWVRVKDDKNNYHAFGDTNSYARYLGISPEEARTQEQ